MAKEITLETVCIPSADVVAREIEGEIIIVPLTAGIGDAEGEIFTLNETANVIWQELDGKRTLGEILQTIGNEFDGNLKDIEKDLLGFVHEMVRRGILNVLEQNDHDELFDYSNQDGREKGEP